MLGTRCDVPTAVGIVGSYGGLNAGDEAILTVAIAQLRAAVADVEIVVFSRDCDHTRRHHDVERVVAADAAEREDLLAVVKRLDLMLLGGGGILYDREAEFYLRLVRLAQKAGIATATYAVGAGPLERSADRASVAAVLNRMDLITVREAAAKRLLEESGVERAITVTADPAVLLQPEPFTEQMLEREGLAAGLRLIGMSVREGGRAMSEISESETREIGAQSIQVMPYRSKPPRRPRLRASRPGRPRPACGRTLRTLPATPGPAGGRRAAQHVDARAGRPAAGIPSLPVRPGTPDRRTNDVLALQHMEDLILVGVDVQRRVQQWRALLPDGERPSRRDSRSPQEDGDVAEHETLALARVQRVAKQARIHEGSLRRRARLSFSITFQTVAGHRSSEGTPWEFRTGPEVVGVRAGSAAAAPRWCPVDRWSWHRS